MTTIVGIYRVCDADQLEGWTDETLADALRGPLEEIGIEVEVGQAFDNPVIYGELLPIEADSLRDQIKNIVDRVVTQ